MIAKKTFFYSGTFTPPAGVTRVIVKTTPVVQRKLGTNLGTSFLVDVSNNAWAVGLNTNGALGTNTSTATAATSSPVQVSGGISWKQIRSSGTAQSGYGIDINNVMYSWGSNANGQLGQGGVAVVSSPVLVVGGLRWGTFMDIQNPNGNNTMGAIDSQGRLFMWGLGTFGQLGNNAMNAVSSPVQVTGGLKWSWASLSNSCVSTYGVDNAGNGWAWGLNANGQLGAGNITNTSSPVQVVGGISWNRIWGNASSTAGSYAMGLDQTGNLWGWGYNGDGNLGNGTRTTVSSPVQVIGGLKFTDKLVFVIGDQSNCWLAIDTSGNMWSAGLAQKGEHGNGTNGLAASTSSPVQVAGGIKWTNLWAGWSCVWGLDSNNQLWGWGVNSNGQLGAGNVTSVSSPVQVVGGLQFADFFVDEQSTVAISQSSVIGIDIGGQAWGWGYNANGQLGQGTVTAVSSPVQVVGAKTYQMVNQIQVIYKQEVVPGQAYGVVVNNCNAAFNGFVLGPATSVIVEFDQ